MQESGQGRLRLQPQHRALVDYWRSLRSTSPIPPVSAFDPAQVEGIWEAVFMLDPTPPDFTVRAWPPALTDLIGWDLTGQPYLMLTGKDAYLDNRRVLLWRAAIDQRAIVAYSALFWGSEESKTGLVAEEVYLPLASDNDCPGRVVGSIRLVEPDKRERTNGREFMAWRIELFSEIFRSEFSK